MLTESATTYRSFDDDAADIARCGEPAGVAGGGACRWYVAATHPRKELWAIEHLAQQGFATFFPRFRKRQTHRRRVETTLSPAFPGYVFVAFNRDENGWTSINSTRGVRRLVGPTHSRPQPVSTRAMDLLQKRCRSEIMVNLLEDPRPGDLVQIQNGPLATKIAKIESLDDKGRVSLLFEMMGSERSMTLSIGDIGPVLG